MQDENQITDNITKSNRRPSLQFKLVRSVLIFTIIVTLVFIGGYYFGRKGFVAEYNGEQNVTINRQQPTQYEDLDFGLFWRVWDTLEANYLLRDDINRRDLVYGAIAGMVKAVGDPYTFFLPPKENTIVQEDLSGDFEGVGIQIGFKGNKLAVIAPLPGTPAEEAGILPGDLIAGIIDETRGIDLNTSGISLNDAVETIRGPAGSKVTLVITRDNLEEPLLIDVLRKKIDVPSVTFDYIELEGRKYAHVKVLRFVMQTKEEWDKFAQSVLSDPEVDGIILDVRNNPGGIMQAAVDIAADFVDTGTVIVKEENSTGNSFDYKTESLPRLAKYPVYVLINEGSASASEILAGALRDVLGTQLVGEKSFGKGTIQEPRQLEGGAGLHITTNRWLTPNGHWVHDVGIVPDVEVVNDLETETDEQLETVLSLF